MKPHYLATSFPSMSDADFTALVADIKANGQRDPITLYEGMILDGWHRFQACAELDIKPWKEEFSDADPVAFVLSRNLHRRHLSASQRAVAVTACHAWQVQGGDRKSKANVSLLLSTAEMAAEAGVSPQTIKDAKTAIKTGQAADVTAGKISVSKAAEKASGKSRKPAPPPEPEPPDEDQPDIAKEFEVLSNENDKLQSLVTSLSKTDLAQEVVTWKGKFEAVCGRVNQLLTTQKELEKTANHQAGLLKKIRSALGVEKNSEIMGAINK